MDHRDSLGMHGVYHGVLNMLTHGVDLPSHAVMSAWFAPGLPEAL